MRQSLTLMVLGQGFWTIYRTEDTLGGYLSFMEEQQRQMQMRTITAALKSGEQCEIGSNPKQRFQTILS